jgi:pyroglutamyl-peptidase
MRHAAEARPTVLLTGFGPFPGVVRNASADLVKALVRRARREMPEYRFVSAILPTQWARIPTLIVSLHARHVPTLVLHFGVAADVSGIRIETAARNICGASPDAAGRLPDFPNIEDGGPDIREVTLPARTIAATLENEGHPVSLSDDAGGYLCNAALYRSLAIAERNGNACRTGFVHIPADLSVPPTTFSAALQGAFKIIGLALEHGQSQRPLTEV